MRKDYFIHVFEEVYTVKHMPSASNIFEDGFAVLCPDDKSIYMPDDVTNCRYLYLLFHEMMHIAFPFKSEPITAMESRIFYEALDANGMIDFPQDQNGATLGDVE